MVNILEKWFLVKYTRPPTEGSHVGCLKESVSTIPLSEQPVTKGCRGVRILAT